MLGPEQFSEIQAQHSAARFQHSFNPMPRFALLLTTLIWGATFPATKAALDQIPPLSFLFLRFLLGAVLVGLCLVLVARPVSTDRAVLRASAIATGWLFLGYVLQTVGLGYTTASNSAFITTLYVVFVPLILRRFGPRSWVAAGIATVGLWCLVKPTTSVNLGDLLTLGCALAFAAFPVPFAHYRQRRGRKRHAPLHRTHRGHDDAAPA